MDVARSLLFIPATGFATEDAANAANSGIDNLIVNYQIIGLENQNMYEQGSWLTRERGPLLRGTDHQAAPRVFIRLVYRKKSCHVRNASTVVGRTRAFSLSKPAQDPRPCSLVGGDNPRREMGYVQLW
jgi:hypothetical protein